MKTLFSDPLVLGAGGILLVAGLLFIWGIRRLLHSSYSSNTEMGPIELEVTSSEIPLKDLPFSTGPKTTLPLAEQVNKDMAQKLETMTQRLADMQSLMNKQNASASNAPVIPPETLDKMLQSVNTVIQQVDVLQKSIDTSSPTSAGPLAAVPSSPMGSMSAASSAPLARPAAPVQAAVNPVSSPTIISVSELAARNPPANPPA